MELYAQRMHCFVWCETQFQQCNQCIIITLHHVGVAQKFLSRTSANYKNDYTTVGQGFFLSGGAIPLPDTSCQGWELERSRFTMSLFHMKKAKQNTTVRCQDYSLMLLASKAFMKQSRKGTSHWKHSLVARLIACSPILPLSSRRSNCSDTYCHC